MHGDISEIRLMELCATYELLRSAQEDSGNEAIVSDWAATLSDVERKYVQTFDSMRGILATEVVIEGAGRILSGGWRAWTIEDFRAEIDPVAAIAHARAVERINGAAQ